MEHGREDPDIELGVGAVSVHHVGPLFGCTLGRSTRTGRHTSAATTSSRIAKLPILLANNQKGKGKKKGLTTKFTSFSERGRFQSSPMINYELSGTANFLLQGFFSSFSVVNSFSNSFCSIF
ncbi:hypothetical protein CEXT_671181 [Caerostris extrusa]|uniref:Uncharacterized protein n=1 Tax=Caerostris extrusa TaxID=172846 RepID=A0AAV4N9K5_CAEEX|nr:hypothetical protein CEXT_671181 [Caerostris extrusa]